MASSSTARSARAIVVAWLVLIFASFGYRAPTNAVVGTTFVVSAFPIAAAIHLIVVMGSPSSGPIRISPAPMQRAAEQGASDPPSCPAASARGTRSTA
jgi:hypothetical protein